jgi:hypothetical protein
MAKKQVKDEDTLKELDYVAECLRDAAAYGLEHEVVLYALKAMKSNPDITIQVAMERGMEEWDV